jgi:hypothetical protein
VSLGLVGHGHTPSAEPAAPFPDRTPVPPTPAEKLSGISSSRGDLWVGCLSWQGWTKHDNVDPHRTEREHHHGAVPRDWPLSRHFRGWRDSTGITHCMRPEPSCCGRWAGTRRRPRHTTLLWSWPPTRPSARTSGRVGSHGVRESLGAWTR